MDRAKSAGLVVIAIPPVLIGWFILCLWNVIKYSVLASLWYLALILSGALAFGFGYGIWWLATTLAAAS